MIRDYAERMENKAARLRDRAANVSAKGEAAYETARRIGDMIPMGQPILVGHHSERRHRRDIERIDRGMRASIEATKTAARLEAAADRAENPTAVSSDDPTAVGKLRTKLNGLEALQDRMKRANAIVLPEARKGDDGAGKWQERAVARLVSEGLMGEANARKLCEPDFANRLGFASYNLTNNGAEIRRVKARIEALERSAAAPEHEPVIIGDVEIREDKGLNRVQIVFPGKPAEAVRTKLKVCGFRWCRSEGAWQRQASAGAFDHAVRVMREASEGAAQWTPVTCIAVRIPLSERGLMAVYTYQIEALGRVTQVAFHGPHAPHHGARRRNFALRYALAVARGESDPCGFARRLRGKVD